MKRYTTRSPRVAQLFWRTVCGFEINPYDFYLSGMMIERKKYTVLWQTILAHTEQSATSVIALISTNLERRLSTPSNVVRCMPLPRSDLHFIGFPDHQRQRIPCPGPDSRGQQTNDCEVEEHRAQDRELGYKTVTQQMTALSLAANTTPMTWDYQASARIIVWKRKAARSRINRFKRNQESIL